MKLFNNHKMVKTNLNTNYLSNYNNHKKRIKNEFNKLAEEIIKENARTGKIIKARPLIIKELSKLMLSKKQNKPIERTGILTPIEQRVINIAKLISEEN